MKLNIDPLVRLKIDPSQAQKKQLKITVKKTPKKLIHRSFTSLL
jgi:hypothetical protein